MTPESLTELRLVGSPSLHPDGTSVVAPVRTVAPDRRGYRSRLFHFTEAGTATPLTDDAGSDTAPAHSLDGTHIAYLSNRAGQRRIQLTKGDLPHPPGQATTFTWLNETTLVAVVEVPDTQPASGDPITIDWLRYKRDGEPGFIEPIHELWALSPDHAPELLLRPNGRITCLTAGAGFFVYALDSRHTDNPTPPTEVHRNDLTTDTLLWTFSAKVTALAVTDRSGLAVAVSNAQPGESATPPIPWLLGDGEPQRAFPLADLEVERAVIGDCRPNGPASILQPVAGSDDVVLLATIDEDAALYRGNPTDPAPRRITEVGVSVTDFSVTRNGRTAACVESPTAPVELVLLDQPTPVTALNTHWRTQTRPVAPETVHLRTQGLRALLYRADDTPGPLIIRVHGGPHMSWGTAFDFETQLLVRAGYRVLLPNIGGSSGRGTEFRHRVVGEWGRADHGELMAFADWAIAHGVADPDRMYLAGGSYGGYLINWTLTRTNRFRAAVSERSIANLLSKFGTSDNGYTANLFEFGGADLFDESVETLLERSPLRHARSITTPMLLLHGETDYRCPIEQSEQLFTALRRLGREAKFVRFPGGSHSWANTGRPDHRMARLHLILDWFAEHGGRPLATRR
ncbi:MAG TPA: S9 family peptidase [Pseudonocardiaceae bacterium]|nr:S9 family peptidase [Pseudonocardiaceae bacterium]